MENTKQKLKFFDIWTGYYHLGQGYSASNKPEKVGAVKATSFKIACCIFEHQQSIDSLNRSMERGEYIGEDINYSHFGSWYYNPTDNSNSWTGKYFETGEEAWKTFQK